MHTCASPACRKSIQPGQRRRPGPDGQTICNPCYIRWHKAGRPADVPPPPEMSTGHARGLQRHAEAAARAEQARTLALVYSPEEIAAEMGLTVTTVNGYLRSRPEMAC
ncbi:hypothetical protein AB0K18_43060 [Nonomuraea sp. NPDC049421]|uniref:hypothetical protein n=1 Tax=Nonomuraea sp. NPDC049421 TaxID=3155275 RepID=UPI003444CCE9